MNEYIPFPQADKLEKVLTIVNIKSQEDLQDVDKLSVALGNITPRVVRNYRVAARYLDIIDEHYKFTKFGQYLRESAGIEQTIHLCMKIMSKDVFAEVFFRHLILGTEINKENTVNTLKKYVKLNTEGMYERRAQTVIKWVEWVNNHIAIHQPMVDIEEDKC